MRHGHVAVVTRVINSRQVLVDHANWAPHRGRDRGQISKMVAVTDVSPQNDWTEVRVWNASSQDFGTRTYPTYGFIYSSSGQPHLQQASLSEPETTAASSASQHRSAADALLATADRQIAAVLAEADGQSEGAAMQGSATTAALHGEGDRPGRSEGMLVASERFGPVHD